MTRRFLLPLLIVALTLTALLAASGPAGAAQLDLVGSSTFGSPSLYPYQQWADDSYAPTYPGAVQLTFSPALLTCGAVAGAVGCTDWSQWPLPQVAVYTGNGPYSRHEYLMHELGHVFDATEMQDPFRADFMTIWGLPGGASAWWTPFGSGNGSPGEWFAESYRLCALYGPQMPYEDMADGLARLRLPGRPRLGPAGRLLPAHPAGRRRGGPAHSDQPHDLHASRAHAREPQGGRMPRQRPAGARQAGAVREGGRRLSSRPMERHAPDPTHEQGGAPPRSSDSRQRPAGVRARPSVAERAPHIATSCPSPAVGPHRHAMLIRPYRTSGGLGSAALVLAAARHGPPRWRHPDRPDRRCRANAPPRLRSHARHRPRIRQLRTRARRLSRGS